MVLWKSLVCLGFKFWRYEARRREAVVYLYIFTVLCVAPFRVRSFVHPPQISHPVITLCLRFTRESFPPNSALKLPCHKAEAAAYDWLWNATNVRSVARDKAMRPTCRISGTWLGEFFVYPRWRLKERRDFEMLCNWKIAPWLLERSGVKGCQIVWNCLVCPTMMAHALFVAVDFNYCEEGQRFGMEIPLLNVCSRCV